MKVLKIYKDAKLPTRKNPTDAGLDLYVYYEGTEYIIFPEEVIIVGTGIAVEIPKGYFGWITNKSSKDYLIGGGIVDEGYRGELLVKIINVSGEKVYIQHGDAIAQLLVIPCSKPILEDISNDPDLVDEFYQDKAGRGDDGGIMRQLTKEEEIDKKWYENDYGNNT